MLFSVNGFTDDSDNLNVYKKSNCFYSWLLLEYLNFLQSNLYLQFISRIDLFLTVLGLHCQMGFLSSCGPWGLLSSCLGWASYCGGFSRRPASVAATPETWSTGSGVVVHRFGCSAECGIFPSQKNGSVSPALAGRFFITEPPGTPIYHIYTCISWRSQVIDLL